MERHKKRWLVALLLACFGVTVYTSYALLFEDEALTPPSILKHHKPQLEFHPIDADVQFIDAYTRVILDSREGSSHTLTVHVTSETSIPTTIRQDVALVYANGVLADRVYGGEKETAFLSQDMYIQGQGSTRYDVITFHHAEIEKEDDSMTSQQTLSQDRVYLLSSAITSSSLFREAQTNTQNHWKRILDNAIEDNWSYQWQHLMEHFELDQRDYTVIPLYELHEYTTQSFPGFDQDQTTLLLGLIWETLFERYILEIHPDDHHKEQPQGSIMPIILVANDQTHVSILFRTAEGKEVQIEHPISFKNKTTEE
ncbi:hypothetical protein [Caldalkalibacillus salinus]|uniref:hypothetical protein n=1 Tax=Caldalkalibacillus salinus TaxID=2803787 RepID=UPI001920D2F7|nr:hypothetical protein [Caldalkalibacillus salinus]